MFQMWCIDVYFDNDFLDDIMFRTIQFWIKNLERKKSYIISIEDRTKYFLKFSFENGHLITCVLKHVSYTYMYVDYHIIILVKLCSKWFSFGSKDEPVLDQRMSQFWIKYREREKLDVQLYKSPSEIKYFWFATHLSI